MSVDTTSLYLGAAGLVATYAVLSIFILPLFSSQSKYLRSQPWVGLEKQWFSSFRAGLASVFGTRGMLTEGYNKFSKNNKLFVLPQLSSAPYIVLPADKVHEFLSKGDENVDHVTIGSESIAMRWTVGTEFSGDSHFNVVRRQLTRKLPQLTTDVHAELVLGMEDNWPAKSDSWLTVNVYPTCMKIVSRAANRVFSGKDLCRNPQYLDASRMYTQEVFKAGMIMRLLPKFMHPILAPLTTYGVKKQYAICSNISVPVIKERMRQTRELGSDFKAPNDVLQWTVEDGLAAPEDQAYKRDPHWLCRCLLLMNMVAIHTTSMVTTNTLIDLFTSPDRDEYIAGLREECERVFREHGGEWNKDAVNSLLRVDSAIRETMRWTGLSDYGVARIVKAPNGLDLGSDMHIPHGVRVAIPAHNIHHDDRFYPDPHKWDAFRFSRPREEYMSQVAQQPEGTSPAHLAKMLDLKNQGLIVTTDEFFSFGFGKHACPGRFFASQEMKLMLAHMLMNYDIEMDGPRPANLSVNGAVVPKDDVQMRIRLRQKQ